MPYVISTLSQPQDYAFYDSRQDGGSTINILKHTIHIEGGQGVVNRRTLIAPDNGVITEISDSDAELLKEHPVFKIHQQNGYVRISNLKMAAQSAVKHMEGSDDSAQLTADDFGDSGVESSGLKINNEQIQPRRKGRSTKRK